MAEVITPDEVERVAALARLALSDEERRVFTRQLADILAYAQRVTRAEVDNLLAAAAPGEEGQPLRPDVVAPSLPLDDVLSNAPDADPESGLFRVPQVLGG